MGELADPLLYSTHLAALFEPSPALGNQVNRPALLGQFLTTFSLLRADRRV